MRINNYSLCLLLTILCACSTIQNVKHVSLKENKKESLNRKAKNILVLGLGSTTSRIFLDKLSAKLITGLTKYQVRSSYQYLGKSTEEATENYKKLEFKGDDLMLLISPNDSSIYQVFTSRNINSFNDPNVGIVNYTTVISNVMYQQQFKLTLYDLLNEKKQVWSSLLNVECELGKSRINTIITDLIISSFNKSQYLP